MEIEEFSEICRLHYSGLCFLAGRLLDDAFAAKEVVQDVFISLWESRHKTVAVRNWKVYLAVATRNRCVNYRSLENRRRQKQEDFAALPAFSDETVIQHIIRAELAQELAAAVGQLPEQCRKIIQLTYQEGKSSKEISEELCLAESTVRNQKARGLKLLKRMLSNDLYNLLLFLL